MPAERWVARFHEAHRERYGYARPQEPIEAVTVRAVASVPAPPFETPTLERAAGEPPSTSARVILGGDVLDARRMLLDGKLMYARAVTEQHEMLSELLLICGLDDLKALRLIYATPETETSNP